MTTKSFSFANLVFFAVMGSTLVFGWALVQNLSLSTTTSFQAEDQLIVYPTKTVSIARPVAAVQSIPVPTVNPAPLPVMPPKVISRVMPEYPASLVESGVHGIVSLRVLVSSTGKVDEIQVKAASGNELLDKSAVSAVSSWTFEPAKRGSEAVSSWFEIPVRFEIR